MAGFKLRVMMEGRLDLINVDADFLVTHVFFTGLAQLKYADQPLTLEVQQDGQTVARHEYKPTVVDIDDETIF